MTARYKTSDEVKARRLEALKEARWQVSREGLTHEQKIDAGNRLLDYDCFTAAQVAEWLGVSEGSLKEVPEVPGWGIRGLKAEQLNSAADLAVFALGGIKPKTLIYWAYTAGGMSFDIIGGLLGQHKNTIRRIVRRIDGRPWT